MEYSKEDLKRSGIYAIVNIKSGQAYVGRARIFRDRFWRHVGALKSGSHPNRPLQDDWTFFGQDAFYFEILEFVPRYPSDLMKRREWVHMCTYSCLYNLKVPAKRWTGTKESEVTE